MRGDSIQEKGSLSDVFVGELLCHYYREHETGVLEVSFQGVRKDLFFQDGRIIFSETSDPDERLGLFLLRRKKVTYRNLLECATKVRPNQRFGGVLVLEGYLQPDDLYQGVVGQVKEMTLSLFELTGGEYQFHRGPLNNREVITLNLSTPDLVIAGMTRVWRWGQIWKGLGSLDVVLRKHEAWSLVARDLTATPDTRMLLNLFDRPRTLEEILQLSSLGDFETCRLVWAFLMLGIIEEILVAPKWESTEEQAESAAEIKVSTAEIPVPQLEEMEQSKNESKGKDHSDESTARIQMQSGETEGEELSEKIESPSFDELEPELDTQSMPLIKAEDLDRFRQEEDPDSDTARLLVQPQSPTEISFADLAELTDAVRNEEQQAISETNSKSEIRKEDIVPELHEFNEMHRYLFEMVQLDLGPRVTEFLSRAFIKAATRFPLVFEGVRVNEYGELNERTLITNVEVNLVHNLPEALRFLLREEKALVRNFLDPRRADVIEAGMEDVKAGPGTMR